MENCIYSDLIPSSFVKKKIKRINETGHGEAKLYLAKTYSSSYYLDFFNNYSKDNIYCFNKNNLLNYMLNSKVENKYKSRSKQHKEYWEHYVSYIN